MNSLSLWEELILLPLRCGPVPQHVSFIMDGNRRYATQLQKSTISGHKNGFDKLNEVLLWCNVIGISTISVYAFSIDNYKRSSNEVEGLFKLAHEKFNDILWHQNVLHSNGVRVRISGDRSLLPLELQIACANIEKLTSVNSRLNLIICFSYSALDELAYSLTNAHSKYVNNEEIGIEQCCSSASPVVTNSSSFELDVEPCESLPSQKFETTATLSTEAESSSPSVVKHTRTSHCRDTPQSEPGSDCKLNLQVANESVTSFSVNYENNHNSASPSLIKASSINTPNTIHSSASKNFYFELPRGRLAYPPPHHETAESFSIPDVDLMLRTSGETRLSDYMLVESCMRTRFYFINSLWPELSVKDLAKVLLHYKIAVSCSLSNEKAYVTRTPVPLGKTLRLGQWLHPSLQRRLLGIEKDGDNKEIKQD